MSVQAAFESIRDQEKADAALGRALRERVDAEDERMHLNAEMRPTAPARTDTERLDWIERKMMRYPGSKFTDRYVLFLPSPYAQPCLRSEIDAAMDADAGGGR